MQSSLLYESVFNSNPIGNILFSPTSEAIILAVNNAFLMSSSRKREDLVGISVYDAFPGSPDDPKDTGEDALRDSINHAIETGIAQTMPVQRYPITVALPSGDVRYEERFWSAVNTPVFDGNGKLLCISHTTADITDTVRANLALRESEGRLGALVAATADVVYRMSPDWTQMQPLEGRGFLKDTTETGKYEIGNYVPSEDHKMVHRVLDQAIRDKTIFALEHRVLRSDGSIGWTYSRAVPMLDAHGEIYEWIGAASDITDRKFAEEKLKDADRRKDEFLAMLAHELRNPLAPIGAAAELLQIAKLDETRVHQTSQIIGRQVDHMTRLIDDLLDVSRVTRGLVKLDPIPVDIRHVVSDAVEQVTPLIQSHHHHFTLQMQPDAAIVMGDKKRLVQVLTNLLNNAAKYTNDGGNILLKTEVRDSHVVLEVIDDGIGMTSELATHAFDLFAQGERDSDRSAGGLGLGLALVKNLLGLHHGTISCESEGIGKGSKFTICLPRFVKKDYRDKQLSLDGLVEQSARPLKIMVVDDNKDAVTMLAMLLEAAGHDVSVTYSSKQALELAQAEVPEVCLLDIGLPEMDGNELAQRLRAKSETAKSVLIAITGYGQENDRGHALAAGFDHHFVKPVDTKRLASVLAEVSKI